MLKKRLIPVLILRDGHVVQSIQFRHTNVIHSKPSTAVRFFDRWAVDEIILLDVSPTPEKRHLFYEAVSDLATECFVPLTVGGRIGSPADVRQLLRLGADKVAINTQAVRRPELITECAKAFGRQCIVVSIDTRIVAGVRREVFVERGTAATGLDPRAWAIEAEARGAGEVLLTSIDHDGSRRGYDLEVLDQITRAVNIPVMAFGGVLTWEHLVEGIRAGAEAVCAANIFHYTEHSTKKAKAYMRAAGIDVR